MKLGPRHAGAGGSAVGAAAGAAHRAVASAVATWVACVVPARAAAECAAAGVQRVLVPVAPAVVIALQPAYGGKWL